MRRGSRIIVSALAAALLAPAGCVVNEGEKVDLGGQDVLLTLLHTSDTHSRLFPYALEVGQVDATLGLLQDNGPFGGGARLAYLVKRERGRAGRSLWVDTGDPFQGAPIFNYFEGEAEFRVWSEIGVDVMAIGNHEFDRGGPNLAKQLDTWARFPALAANYRFEPSAYSPNELGRLVKPYVVFNLRGLRVAVIGIGDVGSMFSIFETGNKLGITPLNVVETTQQWVDFLRPQVDVIVVATHQGLSGDEYTIRHTEGIDVLLGGHLHIVLDPPKVLADCQDEELQRRTGCTPRPVILAHSGGFMKYLGRLDVVLRQNPADPRNGYEVASHEYTLYPVDSTVPEDPAVAYLLEPYRMRMEQPIDLNRLIGYAPATVRRFGMLGGDSQLGNLVADSMWLRNGIETDFALTNTTGIRTDLNAGPVTTEAMFNVFPFDNTITTMFLSGLEVQDLFDYVARRTASRGCGDRGQLPRLRAHGRAALCGVGGHRQRDPGAVDRPQRQLRAGDEQLPRPGRLGLRRAPPQHHAAGLGDRPARCGDRSHPAGRAVRRPAVLHRRRAVRRGPELPLRRALALERHHDGVRRGGGVHGGRSLRADPVLDRRGRHVHAARGFRRG
jgi:5'-nucleotidase/UDP-sugar diphosphatase